jgi:hypothetical protein
VIPLWVYNGCGGFRYPAILVGMIVKKKAIP